MPKVLSPDFDGATISTTGAAGKKIFVGSTDPSVSLPSGASALQAGDLWIPSGSLLATVDLPDTTTPGTPAADNVRMFSQDIGGRSMLAMVGSSGAGTPLQPHLGRNAISAWHALGGSTTAPTAVGAAALSATGTATALVVASTSLYTTMRQIEWLVTAASNSAVVGWRLGANNWLRGSAAGQGGFHFVCRLGVATGSTLSTRRFFCGLTSQTAAPTDVQPSTDTTLANVIGIGADSTDTNYQFMTKTGTGTATKVNTGIAKAASADRTDVLEISIFCAPNGGTIFYTITKLNTGATFSGSTSTTLPATTQVLGPLCYASVGGTSSVMGLGFRSMTIESDN